MVDIDEKIRALRLIFGQKDELLRILASEFGLTLRSTAAYSRIIQDITDKGIESKFCQRVFHADNFDEGVLIIKLSFGLQTLQLDNLRDLAEILSDNEKKWRFSKRSSREIIDAIVRNCSKDDVDEKIYRLIEEGRLDPVQQYHEWVVGPLGITESVSRRNTIESDSLVSFLLKHLEPSICEEALDLSGFVPLTKLERSLLQPKAIQLVLTHGTDEDIFRLFNQLLDTGRLKIQAPEAFYSFLVTPAGIFKQEYEDPLGKLADLLISHLSEETLRQEFGLDGGNLRLQIIRECLNRKPDEVLERLFGMPDLRRIARTMGLVAIDYLREKKQLVEAVLLKLGFEVPRPPKGILAARRIIERNLRDLESVDLHGRTGVVTVAYVQLESLLKDLVFFYVIALWGGEIEYEEYEDVQALDSFVRSRFKTYRPVNRLTFGELVDLLARIDGKANEDEKTRIKLYQQLHRKTILLGQQKDSLRSISARRRIFAHDAKVTVRPEDCITVLTEMLDLLRDLDRTGVYPKLVLVTNVIVNEYGIRSAKAVDEEGLTWTIKSDKYWLDPAQQYFLTCETPGVAIDPIAVERFWQLGT